MDIKNMVNDIRLLVEDECKKDSNAFGYGIWSHHIVYVIKFGRILAEKLGADKEIVEISALLHDLAGIKNKEIHDQHHLYGAQEAERILSGYGYPAEKIERVKKCILSHRGSVDSERLSPEEICVTSADAMAHIDQMVSLLYYVYHKCGLNIDDGKLWVKDKLVRSWSKLCPEAKEIIRAIL
ncbi:MAG: HD domain-containing protein [Firmicutes bacterium]|nr:HD domain-containing protein [Bacillota bacterium]